MWVEFQIDGYYFKIFYSTIDNEFAVVYCDYETEDISELKTKVFANLGEFKVWFIENRHHITVIE